jgi:tetratricopeptide (TPR) repeat protein
VALFGIHTLYDWDWDIPGVTLPALVTAGVLAGGAARRSSAASVSARRLRAPAVDSGRVIRGLALSAITATLAVFAFSGVVPSVAASRASSALVAASTATGPALEHDLATAQSATRLDPLSDAGLLTASTIATRLGEIDASRDDLIAAVKRDPTDAAAWEALAFAEDKLGDRADAIKAVQRVAALDPMGKETRNLQGLVTFENTPPSDSATAQPAPLPNHGPD